LLSANEQAGPFSNHGVNPFKRPFVEAKLFESVFVNLIQTIQCNTLSAVHTLH